MCTFIVTEIISPSCHPVSRVSFRFQFISRHFPHIIYVPLLVLFALGSIRGCFCSVSGRSICHSPRHLHIRGRREQAANIFRRFRPKFEHFVRPCPERERERESVCVCVCVREPRSELTR